MGFMEWATDVASAHPELEGAFINADGDWLDILLADGRSFRFRPGQMIDAERPEAERRVLLDRLLTIGVAQAEGAPAEPEAPAAPPLSPLSSASASDESGLLSGSSADSSDPDETLLTPDQAIERLRAYEGLDPDSLDNENIAEHIMPIVRSADYFVSSHDHSRDDSIIYVPLTPFIGAGIAVDGRDSITPLFFSDADRLGLPLDIVTFFQKALGHLRESEMTDGQPSVQVQPHPIAGAMAYEFAGPANYQSSWFLDVEMALMVAKSLSQAHDDALPLFIPAARDELLIVMADDPHLPDMLHSLSQSMDSSNAVYALPHVVSADGWSEWIPMPDHAAAPILAKMRGQARKKIYDEQLSVIENWPQDFGTLAPFDVVGHKGMTATCAMWPSLGEDGTPPVGSIPDTDLIAFLVLPSPHPWESQRKEYVIVRSHVAREIWPGGISEMHNVWPPRWNVVGFPDEETLTELRKAADREF